MSIFLTSDTHFYHNNILNLGEGRPFTDINHHNETLIRNWNNVVSSDDIVFHLGDVCFGQRRETLPIMDRLNGFIILIPGNHDNVSSLHPKREEWMEVYSQYFNDILDETIVLGEVVLSHYPPAEIPDHGEDRYPHLRPELSDDVPLYIHGHTHQSNPITVLSNGSIARNVGVDANGWTPVNLETVLDEAGLTTNRAAWYA